MLVWSGRQRIRYAEAFATVRAFTDDDAKEINKAWDKFGDALYPYRKSQEKKRKTRQADILNQWVSQGPITITPEVATRTMAKHQQLLRKGQETLSAREKAVQQGEIVRISSQLWRERMGAKPMEVTKAKRRDS